MGADLANGLPDQYEVAGMTHQVGCGDEGLTISASAVLPYGAVFGSPMAIMAFVSPYVIVREPAFVARFLLDSAKDTEESVANVDAFVDLPDGSAWALTMFTVDEVRRLLALWKESGEVANGSYFWCTGGLIVAEPGVRAMAAAIRELVRTGEIATVAIRCRGHSEM
jgi:hypothetical protein